MRIAIALAATLLVSCLPKSEYHCATSADCGSQGTCESVGVCSFPDPSCPSSQRFGEASGSYANQCVGDLGPIDAGVDGSGPIDAVDGAPVGCPGTYTTISSGTPNHVYRLTAGGASWDAQRAACTATSASAYLAIPDDLAELQAMITLSPTTNVWIGISDTVTEGTFVTVRGAVPPFLPWITGAPDDGPPSEDCVDVVSTLTQINDERCNTSLRAICECEQ